MEYFGVHFRIDREDMFPSLVAVFDALKTAKIADEFPDIQEWLPLLHSEARTHFYWPSPDEQAELAVARATRPVIITEPSEAIGQEWDFSSLLDAVRNGEYQMLEVAKVSDETAELRINPESYPYGGIGAFIALIEAHGMYVLGVNEYGKYQPRAEFVSSVSNTKGTNKPWWKFWQ
jgi:hypothetical protein